MKMADLVVEYWNDKGSELYNSYRFEDIKAFLSGQFLYSSIRYFLSIVIGVKP